MQVHCWPCHLGLAIQDPFETFYNVGHVVKLWQFHRIRREFARAYTVLVEGGGLDKVCEKVEKADKGKGGGAAEDKKAVETAASAS